MSLRCCVLKERERLANPARGRQGSFVQILVSLSSHSRSKDAVARVIVEFLFEGVHPEDDKERGAFFGERSWYRSKQRARLGRSCPGWPSSPRQKTVGQLVKLSEWRWPVPTRTPPAGSAPAAICAAISNRRRAAALAAPSAAPWVAPATA